MRPSYNASIEERILFLTRVVHQPAEPSELRDALRVAMTVIEELQSELTKAHEATEELKYELMETSEVIELLQSE